MWYGFAVRVLIHKNNTVILHEQYICDVTVTFPVFIDVVSTYQENKT